MPALVDLDRAAGAACLGERRRLGGIADVVEEQADFEVVKHKKFNLRPMSEDEAILQMNMLEHAFFMFRNAKTGEINVVYRRDDGNYAVLEPSEAYTI